MVSVGLVFAPGGQKCRNPALRTTPAIFVCVNHQMHRRADLKHLGLVVNDREAVFIGCHLIGSLTVGIGTQIWVKLHHHQCLCPAINVPSVNNQTGCRWKTPTHHVLMSHSLVGGNHTRVVIFFLHISIKFMLIQCYSRWIRLFKAVLMNAYAPLPSVCVQSSHLSALWERKCEITGHEREARKPRRLENIRTRTRASAAGTTKPSTQGRL